MTTLAGVDPTDAAGHGPRTGGTLYFADIGDNSATRRTVTVYWIDQPRRPTRRSTHTRRRWSIPGVLATPRHCWSTPPRVVFTWCPRSCSAARSSPHRAVCSTDHTNRLQPVGTAPSLVTDGTFLPSGQVVLRTYTSAVVYDPSSWTALSSTTLPEQPQGESIAALPGPAEVLVGSEGVDSAVYEVRLNLDAQFSDDLADQGPGAAGETPPLTGSRRVVVPPATGAAPASAPTAPRSTNP